MSPTAEEIADEVWVHPSRTVDGGAPPDPDGSFLDQIAYQVWIYATRTVDGGPVAHDLVSLPIGTKGSVSQGIIGQNQTLFSGVIMAGIVTIGLSSIAQTATLSSINLTLDQVNVTQCEIGESGGSHFRRHRFNQGRGW